MKRANYWVKAFLLIAVSAFAQSAWAVTCTSVATTQTDWNKPAAWDAACAGQPPAGATVIIASGTNILADANTPIVADITVQAGGILAIKTGNTISLSGNFTNSGTFTAPAGSTVSLTGTNQTITGNVTFANLTVGAGTILTLAGNITVMGTLTGTLNLVSTCPTNYTITNGAGTVIGQSCTTPPPMAEYRMDEGGWSGVAGQVADSSGNGYNAQALNSANTTATTPAIAGNPGTCGYGVFDNSGTITQGYVQTPLPNLTTNFTVTAWIRTTNNTIAGQRILIDDQGTAPATGYGFSLGDGATGILRFYSRGITPILLDSTYTIANNTWYFVAAVADITNKKRTIYVFNTAGTLLSTTTEAAWTGGAWGTDGGPVSIGAETNASAESPASFHFKGNLDEVGVYGSVLTVAQLTAISNKVHACQSGINHVAISAPATDTALTATLVTIAPHDATHAAVSDAGSISLSTSTGLGDWTIGGGTGIFTPGAANSGLATYTFGPGETRVTLGFTYQTAGTVILYVRDAVGMDLLLNTPAGEKANTIIFTMPSFVFTSSVCTNGVAFGTAGQCLPVIWSPQVAGQSLTNVYITAVNASGVPTRLSASARTRNMQFGLSCSNPVANAGKQAVFAAATLPLCQANGAKPATWSAAVTASFPGGVPSAGPYSFNYADVGMVELWMRDSGTPANVGASGAFVVKPGRFVLSNIVRTSDSFANPAAANAAGAAFVKASEAFSVTVTATTCSPATATCTVTGATTPNYGKETTPESVKLTPNNVIAGMVAAPAIGGVFGAFTSGVATGTAFTWGEVGIITLTPSVVDVSYLGAGDVTGTTSGNVGRFYPDHFDTVVTPGMPCPTGLTCPTLFVANDQGFVYSGQSFSLTVTAKNAGGNPTANYNTTTGFAKTTNFTAFGVIGTTTAPTGAGALGVASVTAFATGTLTEAAEKYTFTTTPTAPTNIFIRASDGEASSLRLINPTTTSVEGGVAVMSGRIKISNAYGSEQLPLPMTATVQYYNAAGSWVTSTTDNITPFNTATNIVAAIVKGPLAGANISVANAGAVTVAGGVEAFTLNKSGVTGSADISLNAPNYLLAGSNGGGVNPSIAGRATFGVYQGRKEFIYMRENY